jgi:cytochrome oxidase Cu insertion factor (SCO1/SenC/PrrC family)
MKPGLKFVLLGVLAVLLICGIVWLQFAPATVDNAAIGGPFQLVDSAGHPVTDQAFRGKYMLVYFGYTFCPDVCPTTLADVATALDKLGPRAGEVQPLFITVDPQRDTPAVVGQYAANFSPRLVGLTGTADQIAAVAHAYRVYYARHRTGDGPGDYTMDHSSILYLMGPDGHFIAPIRADEQPEAMAADIARHMT